MSLKGQHRPDMRRRLNVPHTLTQHDEGRSAVLRVEGLHSQWSQQLLLSHCQSRPRPLHREQLRGLSAPKHNPASATLRASATVGEKWVCCSTYHHHGNGEVRSQLVVAPGARGSVAVLIDAFFVDQFGVFLTGVLWVFRHPESKLKGLLQLLVPLGV